MLWIWSSCGLFLSPFLKHEPSRRDSCSQEPMHQPDHLKLGGSTFADSHMTAFHSTWWPSCPVLCLKNPSLLNENSPPILMPVTLQMWVFLCCSCPPPFPIWKILHRQCLPKLWSYKKMFFSRPGFYVLAEGKKKRKDSSLSVTRWQEFWPFV